MSNKDELYHYGVLGMKWGIHRGNSAKVYAKASKKLAKYEKKVDKAQRKANKQQYKADKAASGFFSNQSGERKARQKAMTAQKKANKYKYKAVKWLNKMDKHLSKTPNKVSSEQKALGKKYVDSLRRSREMNVYRTY